MFKHCKGALALALALSGAGAHAAPTRIESFDLQSWQGFVKTLPHPSAVVFSSTECSFCPGTIAALAEQFAKAKTAVPLIVVVIDGDGQPGLLQEAQYRSASRLFVFKGQAAALQHSVNPAWRAITPYVALFGRGTEPKMVLGKPSPQVLADWLSGGGASANGHSAP
jgi:hypothetical protein